MVEKLLAELARLGIILVASDGQLRYYPQGMMTPGLVDRLREHKAEVLEVLNNPKSVTDCQQTFESTDWDDCVEPVPCPECGGLTAWWNPLGDRFCLRCNPPAASRRAIEHVERIRGTCGIPTLTTDNYQGVSSRRLPLERIRGESDEPILTI